MKLEGKITLKGTITLATGLHIGGNKSSLEIGGVDLNVVKTGKGIPFIPGSSLKGKLRSLLAKVRGYEEAKDDDKAMKTLFGDSGGKDDKNGLGRTRLIVRDALLDIRAFDEIFGVKNDRILDFDYSEIKTENTIDRSRGTALHPRQVERVPADAKFPFEIMIDIYEDDRVDEMLDMLKEALELLGMDYLGGHGSRGSGKIFISVIEISNTYGNKINGQELTDSWKRAFPPTQTIVQ